MDSSDDGNYHVSRRGTDGHRLQVPARDADVQSPHRCRAVSGLKALRERNWQNLPIAAKDIDAIVLTHAHLDHCGYLPRLVSQGFRGRIFCTAGTKDLCGIVLPDSGRIQEEDAEQANRHGYSKHAPALPLYTEADANHTLTLLQPVGYERAMPVADGIEVDFINAGHLLGSAYARVRTGGQTILFGGDLGRFNRPVMPDPTMVEHADYLLIESTYGNRVHEDDDDGEKLARAIRETAERGGRVVIPAFAVGRVEELLYWVKKLEAEKRIPVLPVFVDSPMALKALARYTERINELDPDLQPADTDDKAPHGPAAHEDRANAAARQAQQERELCAFCTQKFRAVSATQESKDLTRSKMPAIIISSSGMATGGRVLHHLKAALPEDREYRPAGWLPGRGHARTSSGGWCQDYPDPWHGRSGQRPCRGRELDVRACGLEGDASLAAWLQAAAEEDLPRSWRAGRDAGVERLDHQ